MNKGLFYIKGVTTWINPFQVSSIYKAAGSWHVAMANGSDYPVEEDEYVALLDACKPAEKGGEHEKFRELFEKMKELMDKKD